MSRISSFELNETENAKYTLEHTVEALVPKKRYFGLIFSAFKQI